MSDPYIGEIRMFGGNFAPAGWAFCDGQLVNIVDNDTLFNLIGTTYGGDGQNTFALPDLRGRVPIHMGTSPGFGTPYLIGQAAGVETVTLTGNQIPNHSHALLATDALASASSPANQRLGAAAAYVSTAGLQVLMHTSSIASSGGSQPHENMQPFLCVSFIISLFGIFPTPT